MAEVELVIGGRQYAVACRDGGEAHLVGLARRVDVKVEEARAAVGSANEVRQLLFAALLLADDLAETGAPAPASADTAATAQALAKLADRIEAIADALETEPVAH
jgi:cell division protein ZapA